MHTYGCAGEAAGPRVIYQIDAGSSARDVRKYSDFQDGDTPEDERLLPCGTAFEVPSLIYTIRCR